MDRRQEAKRLCAEEGLTQGEAADRLGVSRRTVERWASEDGWGAMKKAQKVVPIGEAKKPKPKPAQTPKDEPVRVQRRRQAGEIDELELVDLALSDVSAIMGSGEVDARSIGSCAGALCKLIELRLKLKPRSAAELAELAIGLGVNPAEFAREVRQAWEKRA